LVRYRSLDDGWQERLAALRARESAPRPSPTAASGPIRTVCLSFDTPVEMATEEGEGRTLSELLFDSGCGMEIGDGKICWECSQARQPVLITATGGDGEGGKTCLDVWGAMALAGEEPVEEGNASPPDESCNVSIGGGNHVCWECSARAPESTPLPEEPGTEEVPTGDRAAEPVCADFVTAEAVGAEAFERFKLAEALRTGEIRRTESSPLADEITCYGSRSIGEARVFGDEIFYRFDIHTGQILWERIHWREDLPEQLPSKLISKAEAEAIVGGAVERSYLAYLSPERFPSIVVLIDRLGARHPCWMVLALEGGAELSITYVNVVDAVTGKVLGRYCPC
jgi:hypothetical protein